MNRWQKWKLFRQKNLSMDEIFLKHFISTPILLMQMEQLVDFANWRKYEAYGRYKIGVRRLKDLRSILVNQMDNTYRSYQVFEHYLRRCLFKAVEKTLFDIENIRWEL